MQLAPLYPFLHQILKPSFPNCLWQGVSGDRTIALTFDDGPHPIYTAELLEVLAKYDVTASFFWLGRLVARYPAMAQQVVGQKHWIGLHGYDHVAFPRLSKQTFHQSLYQSKKIISRVSDIPPNQIMDVRPPNGLFTPQTLQHLQEWGYRPVMWSVVPEDWVCPGVNRVIARILDQVQSGSIIVLHDGVCGGVDVAKTVDRLIPLLQADGYSFVTIDQMW